MKNFIAQVANDVAQSPATAKATPVAAGFLGWLIASEWLPVIGGVLTFLAGLAFSLIMIWINVTQHRIKMKLMERDLAGKTAREGRQDRRDD